MLTCNFSVLSQQTPLVLCFALLWLHAHHLLVLGFMLLSWQTAPLAFAFPSCCITERKSPCSPQKTVYPTMGTGSRSKWPAVSLQTAWNNAERKKKTGSLHFALYLQRLTVSPNYAIPLTAWWGDTVLEAWVCCVLCWVRIKAIKFCLCIFLLGSSGQRKPRLWQQQPRTCQVEYGLTG